MNRRRRNKVLDSKDSGGKTSGVERCARDRLDEPRRMALDALGKAFEAAELGRDWFAMKGQLGRIDDAVRAVWYASRVRDDGRG